MMTTSVTTDPQQRPRRPSKNFTIILPIVIMVVAMMNVWMVSQVKDHHPQPSPTKSASISFHHPRFSHHRSASSVTTNMTSTTTVCSSLCCQLQQSIGPDGTRNDSKSMFSASFTATLWKQFFWPTKHHFQDEDIGSQATQEMKQLYQQWIQKLLTTLTPHRMEQAWKSSPSVPTIRALYDILEERRRRRERQFQLSSSSSRKLLRIAVLGGSVTAGHDIERNNVGIEMPNPKPTRHKAWPKRLEHWINMVIGWDAVEITNMAVSASSSEIGSMILQYHLFPPEWNGETPDVIVWAFATNDLASYKSVSTATRMERIQKFITQAQNLQCSDDGPTLPLIVLLDDLVLHPGIMHQSQTLSSDIAWLAQWNEALGISIGSALLDVALGNPKESSLHAEWVPSDGKGDVSDAISREEEEEATRFRGHGKDVEGWKHPGRIHPGLGVHVAISGIVLYQLLKEATNFCQAEISEDDDWIYSQPRQTLGDPLPNVPLPPYHTKLDSRKVLPLWRDKVDQYQQECASRRHGEARVQCSYAWVSNRMAQMGTKVQVQEWMDHILVKTTNHSQPIVNWQVNGLAVAGPQSDDKVGWEATAANASFAIEHMNRMEQQRTIQKIIIVCMHSYGAKWKDSRLQVVIQKKMTTFDANPQILFTTQDIVGYHKERTSIYYPYEFQLDQDKAIAPDEILRIDFHLVGGTIFKILGLSFCAN